MGHRLASASQRGRLPSRDDRSENSPSRNRRYRSYQHRAGKAGGIGLRRATWLAAASLAAAWHRNLFHSKPSLNGTADIDATRQSGTRQLNVSRNTRSHGRSGSQLFFTESRTVETIWEHSNCLDLAFRWAAVRRTSLPAVRSRLRCAFARFAMQRFGDRTRVTRCHSQEGQSRTIRRPPSLLPITQGGDADTDHEGKLGLRRLELFPHTLDVCRRKDVTRLGLSFPRRIRPACFMLVSNSRNDASFI